jgi:hypothetical protein
VEWGVNYKQEKFLNLRVERRVLRDLWSPRLGINFYPTPNQVIRQVEGSSWPNQTPPPQAPGPTNPNSRWSLFIYSQLPADEVYIIPWKNFHRGGSRDGASRIVV